MRQRSLALFLAALDADNAHDAANVNLAGSKPNPLQDSLDRAANSRAIMSSVERVPIRRIVGTLHAKF